jgi:hypothetical protein
MCGRELEEAQELRLGGCASRQSQGVPGSCGVAVMDVFFDFYAGVFFIP